jgi:hypothetical protein
MADIRFSDLTAAAVSDVTAATSIVPISIPGGAAPISRKLTFATLVTWLATVGMIAAVITAGGFSSTAGKVSLGAAPGTTAAVNVDASSYANTVLFAKNGLPTLSISLGGGLATIATTNSNAVRITINGTAVAQVDSGLLTLGFGGTSGITFASNTTAQIIGATNGLAVRNSANTRDNFAVTDNGGLASLFNGTNVGLMALTGASGEALAGVLFQGGSASDSAYVFGRSSGTTVKSGILYYDGTIIRSAAEVQNVAAGFGTLDLMKSGGIVRIGAVGAADLVISTGAALATTAIVGFPIIPSCAGTPTGVPTNAGTGKVPMIYDTTANKVWFYNGSWRGIVVV